MAPPPLVPPLSLPLGVSPGGVSVRSVPAGEAHAGPPSALDAPPSYAPGRRPVSPAPQGASSKRQASHLATPRRQPPRRPPPPPPKGKAGAQAEKAAGGATAARLVEAVLDVLEHGAHPPPWRALAVVADLLVHAQPALALSLKRHGWAPGTGLPRETPRAKCLALAADVRADARAQGIAVDAAPSARPPPPAAPARSQPESLASPRAAASAAAASVLGASDDDDDDDDLLDAILGAPPTPAPPTAPLLSARGPPPPKPTNAPPIAPLMSARAPLPPSPPPASRRAAAAEALKAVADNSDDDDDDLFDDILAAAENAPAKPLAAPGKIDAPLPAVAKRKQGNARTGADSDSDWSSDEDVDAFFASNPSGMGAPAEKRKSSGGSKSPFAIKLNTSSAAPVIVPKLSLAPPPSLSGPPSSSSDGPRSSNTSTLASFLAPAAASAIDAPKSDTRSRNASAADARIPPLARDALAALPMETRVPRAVNQLRAGGAPVADAAAVLRDVVAGGPDSLEAAVRGGAVGAALRAHAAGDAGAAELSLLLREVLSGAIAQNALSASLVEVVLGGAMRACEDALDAAAAGDSAAGAAGAARGVEFTAALLSASQSSPAAPSVARAAAQMATPGVLCDALGVLGADPSTSSAAATCCMALHECVKLGGTLKGAVNRAGGKAAIAELLEARPGLLSGHPSAAALTRWLREASATFDESPADALPSPSPPRSSGTSEPRRRRWFGRR